MIDADTIDRDDDLTTVTTDSVKEGFEVLINSDLHFAACDALADGTFGLAIHRGLAVTTLGTFADAASLAGLVRELTADERARIIRSFASAHVPYADL